MSFQQYITHIINEQEIIGDQVEVPNEEFETREDAEDFIHGLPLDAIVTNDVIDPETGDVLLQAGDSKTAMQRYEKSAERDESRRQKNIERLKARHERLEARGAFLEPDEPMQTPEEKYGMTIKGVAKEFEGMGADIAGDWMADNPDADEDEFDQFVQTMAGDMAESHFTYPDPDQKKIIAFLKEKHIMHPSDWAADYIADGARAAYRE